jgi:hypothetical protein
MYVCLCNGVSDKKIRQAVRQFQPQSFQQLRKFVPLEINAVSVYVLRERSCRMNYADPGIQRDRLKSIFF